VKLQLNSSKKLCAKCNRMLSYSFFSKSTRAKSGLQTYCKECTKNMNHSYRNSNLEARKDVERISRKKHMVTNIYRYVAQRAEKKSLPIFSKEDFKIWYNLQPKECEYCGISESLAKDLFGHKLHVDRINPPFGYVIGNVTLACQRCNFVKSCYLTHEQMKHVAQLYFKLARVEG